MNSIEDDHALCQESEYKEVQVVREVLNTDNLQNFLIFVVLVTLGSKGFKENIHWFNFIHELDL